MNKTTIALALLSGLSLPAFAADQNSQDWIFNIGIAQITPNDSSGDVLGGGVGVDSATGLGFGFTRMIDSNWGVEVLAALPFSHNINGTGELTGLKIGETKQLPPTLSVIYQWGETTKYHFGAGLNYTIFFEESASADLKGVLGDSTKLSLDSSTGLALKFGFDTPINDSWNFSGSVRYIDISTTADVIVDGSVAASVNVDIDPWVMMIGVSTTF